MVEERIKALITHTKNRMKLSKQHFALVLDLLQIYRPEPFFLLSGLTDMLSAHTVEVIGLVKHSLKDLLFTRVQCYGLCIKGKWNKQAEPKKKMLSELLAAARSIALGMSRIQNVIHIKTTLKGIGHSVVKKHQYFTHFTGNHNV